MIQNLILGAEIIGRSCLSDSDLVVNDYATGCA